MLASLMLALLVQADAAPLDGAGLRAAMETAVETQDARPLVGQHFRIEVPFTDQRVLKYRAFKRSARWSYDSRKQMLVTSIGLGEITSQNFDAFSANKLDTLPPLQTLYFEVESDTTEMGFRVRKSLTRELSVVGKKTRAESFGLAIPYQANGPSGLPDGYKPLLYNELQRPRGGAAQWAKEMTVVYEGQITDMGLKPEVFCGDYRGVVTAEDVTGQTPIMVNDRQCFITAKVDRVTVMRRGATLARWDKPPKQGF
jgi:hypothetical protein